MHLRYARGTEEPPRGDVVTTASRVVHERTAIEQIVAIGNHATVGERESADRIGGEGRVRRVADVARIGLRIFDHAAEAVVDQRHVGVGADDRVAGEGCPREPVELERLGSCPDDARGRVIGCRRLPPQGVEGVREHAAVLVGEGDHVVGLIVDARARRAVVEDHLHFPIFRYRTRRA